MWPAHKIEPVCNAFGSHSDCSAMQSTLRGRHTSRRFLFSNLWTGLGFVQRLMSWHCFHGITTKCSEEPAKASLFWRSSPALSRWTRHCAGYGPGTPTTQQSLRRTVNMLVNITGLSAMKDSELRWTLTHTLPPAAEPEPDENGFEAHGKVAKETTNPRTGRERQRKREEKTRKGQYKHKERRWK